MKSLSSAQAPPGLPAEVKHEGITCLLVEKVSEPVVAHGVALATEGSWDALVDWVVGVYQNSLQEFTMQAS